MSQEARNHHYIPQCYLKGFTKSGSKKSKITVIDLKRQTHFETIPRNVCGRRDFNRIEVAGVRPDILEIQMSSFEGDVAHAIDAIHTDRQFEGEPRNNILNLIALLAIRSPQMREHWRKFHAQIATQILDLSLASKERWESSDRSMRANGGKSLPKVSYEEVKAFHDSGQYEITVPRERHIDMEFRGMDTILKCLNPRKWLLLITDARTAPFITSDHPVLLTWNNPEEIPLMNRQSPGFGMGDTQVYFPISKTNAVVGEFEGMEGVMEAVPQLVAALNSKTLLHTYEQVYASKLSFPFVTKDQTIEYGNRLFTQSIA